MLAEQVSRSCSRESLHVGEPVTLVIEEERFFGWVASESQAHSIACVAIEFTRGDKRVQNASRLKISRGSEIIYKNIRNYARRRRKVCEQCLRQLQNAEGRVRGMPMAQAGDLVANRGS